MSCAIETLSFQNFYKVLKTCSAGRKDFFDTLTYVFRLALNGSFRAFSFGGNDMNDAEYMRLALVLAERGRGWTAPNPMVGARSEEHTSELSHTDSSRMPSSA